MIVSGGLLEVTYVFEDRDSATDIFFYLDQNENPYDSGSISLGAASHGQFSGLRSNQVELSTSGVAAGVYHLYAKIQDGTHARYDYASASLQVNRSPANVGPSIDSLSPSRAAVSRGDTLGLTADRVSDPDGVARVEFYRETSGPNVLVSTDMSGSDGWTSGTFSTASLAPGAHRFYAVGTDSRGATGAPAYTTVTVTDPNVQAPTLSRISPATVNSNLVEQTITLTGTGFTPTTELLFTDPAGKEYPSNLTSSRPQFDSTTQLRYVIRVGGHVGTWRVRALNAGAPTSNSLTFAVGDAGGNDTAVPTATLAPLTVGDTHPDDLARLTVVYADNVAIDVSTIDTDNLRVNGPNGFNADPILDSVSSSTDGSPRTAVYRFTPPGGSWDAADNGSYSVRLLSNQVFDTAGNAVPSGVIGSFSVNRSGGGGGGGDVGDRFEPNDSLGSATSLGVVQGETRYTNLSLHTSSDEDHFRFTLNGTGRVTLRMEEIGDTTSRAAFQFIYDSAGNRLDQADYNLSIVAGRSLRFDGVAGETYIYRVRGADAGFQYDLEVDAPFAGRPPDRFEMNDSVSAATPLGTISEWTLIDNLTLHDQDDTDYFNFHIPHAGSGNVGVFITDTAADPEYTAASVLLLHEGEFRYIDPAFRESNYTQFALDGLAPGHYRLRVTAIDDSAAYEILIDPPPPPADDHGDDPSGSTTLSLPAGDIPGEIGHAGDRDWFRFLALPGHDYRIAVDSSTLASSRLKVYSPFRAHNDDPQHLIGEAAGNGGSDAIFSFSYDSLVAEHVFLEVEGQQGAVGRYELTIDATERPDDHGDNALTATPVTFGTSVDGALLKVGDTDWFSFDASAGAEYKVDYGAQGLIESILHVYDRNGTTRLASHYIGIGGPPLVWAAPASGKFYVEVTSLSTVNDTGSYTLRVTQQAAPDLRVTVNGSPRSLSPITGYFDQDVSGTAGFSPDGSAITLTGNTWKRLALNHNVTRDTVLEFDLAAADAGEITGIGFENNNDAYDAKRVFQLAGSQRNWAGVIDSEYGGSRHYRIRVGDFYTGSMTHLVFVMDDDADASGNVMFSNVKVYQDTPQPASALKVTVNGSQRSLSPIAGYSDQDASGTAGFSPDGSSLTLTGNTWKRLALNHNVTRDTVLEFDLSAADAGEITGIGFENNNDAYDAKRVFQLAGSQRNWAGVDQTYINGQGHYRIPVGRFYTGSMSHLVFVLDDDADASGNVTFSNVKVYQDTPQPASALKVTVNSSQRSLSPIAGYSDQDASGTAGFSPDGSAITLTGNTWKRLALNHNVTRDTVLEFDLAAADAGEITGIGFENNNDAYDAKRVFQLAGSQRNWAGVIDSEYGGSGHYRIRVGDFYTGSMSHLVFVMDDDADASGNVMFSNVKVYQDTPQPASALKVTVNGSQRSLSPIAGYSDQDASGTAGFSPDGSSLTLTGNTWKRLALNHNVTRDTVLEFDLSAADAGEITGIGFENNNDAYDAKRVFQLAGSQRNWAGVDQTYINGQGHYRIPVGRFYTGSMSHLVFVLDDDADASGNVTFSNVKVYI